MNPYDHTYAGIPPVLATPGAAHVLAYLPFTVLYLVPFDVVSDIRLGFMAADLLVGTCLYLWGRWRPGAASVYLFLPFTIVFSTFYLNATLMAMALIALFLLLESRGRGLLASISFGLALASSQFSFLLLPLVFAYYLRHGRWKEPVLALAAAAVVIAPFLAASPSLFLSETLSFEFARPLVPLFSGGGPVGLMVNPSMSAIASLAGLPVPLYLRALIELLLILALLRAGDLSSLARNCGLLVLASVFVLPDDFFWAYLELPFMLLLFWVSAQTNPGRPKRS
ncbi:MAG: PIG-U family protein [Thaumarchaeota archaeon]|nr:PIG-U family protein [Nitrososphaerota archaeon]